MKVSLPPQRVRRQGPLSRLLSRLPAFGLSHCEDLRLRIFAHMALVEAVAQFTRALDQLATLPGTPALRRMQINLQVALISPLVHVTGFAAPQTKAAVELARLLLEQAEALGEGPEDPLLLFSVLSGFFRANVVAFNGDVSRDLAAQFLALAENKKPRVSW